IRILRARGLRQPELLIASGRNAPQFRWRDAGLQLLPDEEFIAAVRDYNGTPEALLANESLRDLWLPRLRADLTISATYEYVEQRPLECPIVVLVGEEDGLVSEAGLQGWLTETTGGVRYFRYPGNHFFLHSAERLVLAKVHAELMDQLARLRHS
ncbi:MAG: thioesterase II family protein, partial [Sulfurifustis sp.]